MIRLRIAYVIRAIAEALELEPAEPDDARTEYARPSDARPPEPLSWPLEPVDVWRDVTIDYAAASDTDDYWRQGPYI